MKSKLPFSSQGRKELSFPNFIPDKLQTHFQFLTMSLSNKLKKLSKAGGDLGSTVEHRAEEGFPPGSK
ncbi:hypothetical protein JWG45_15575 [Leptospira sp. 201903070]|uniref:Uncharacterized protein n=1 Tax=Leptospira ainlahdjerensis TaxID=2810033 RepID=A0ABS2UH32_9LEPT|nr:hypothetical protein [Leptospira ainlahdjerensis]MBM9578567.1 hypothetical protein [Leptospira ainlahdjerensis]